MTLLIISFLATFGLIVSFGLLLFYRDAVRKRLSSVVAESDGAGADLLATLRNPGATRLENLTKPFQNLLPRNPSDVSIVQKKLIRAGYRSNSALNIFYASKVMVPLALVVLATLSQAFQAGFFVHVIAVAVGFVLPDLWLGNRTSNRHLNIRQGLPAALDMMVIC